MKNLPQKLSFGGGVLRSKTEGAAMQSIAVTVGFLRHLLISSKLSPKTIVSRNKIFTHYKKVAIYKGRVIMPSSLTPMFPSENLKA